MKRLGPSLLEGRSLDLESPLALEEEATRDAKPLGPARELRSGAVEGDRFDDVDSDVSYQPDLEEEPDRPRDIIPDHVERRRPPLPRAGEGRGEGGG
jgi:hypothetical protein